MRQETEAQNLHSFLDRVRLGRRLGLEPFSPTLGVQMRLTDPTVRGRDVLVTVQPSIGSVFRDGLRIRQQEDADL